MTLSSRSVVLVRVLTGLWLGAWGALSLATTGCEAVLGTGDLHDGTGSEAGPGDDDDDGDDASVPTDGGHVTGDATVPTDGSPLDAGDGGGGGGGGEGGSREAGPVSSNPSCATSPSASTCGVTGDQDCCATLEVTGATYDRTYDGGALADPVTVSSFDLDVYEVTVGRVRAYASWLAADGGGAPASGAGVHTHLNGGLGLKAYGGFGADGHEDGWDPSDNTNLTLGTTANATFAAPASCGTTYTTTAGASENRPMSCINWYDAYAFCIWDKGFLPSEAEWELAASGGTQYRPYPWGTTAPDAAHATYGCTELTGCPRAVGTPSQGGGLYGQLDLMGNVAEWALDDYSGTYSDTEGCTDCFERAFLGTTNKVDRGGGFSDTLAQAYLYPQSRSDFTETSRSQIIGFRCARAPK